MQKVIVVDPASEQVGPEHHLNRFLAAGETIVSTLVVGEHVVFVLEDGVHQQESLESLES